MADNGGSGGGNSSSALGKPRLSVIAGGKRVSEGAAVVGADDAEFLIPASDPKTHRDVTLHFRIHPDFAEELHNLFYTRKFPYKNPSDVMRHAMKRHCDWLRGIVAATDANGEPLRTSTEGLEIQNRIARQEERMVEFEQVIETIDRTAGKMLRSTYPGDRDQGMKMLGDLLSDINHWQEGHWKKKYKTMFLARFGQFMGREQNPTPASLTLLADRGPENDDES